MSHELAAEAFRKALLEDDPVQLYEQAPCGYLSTTPEGRIVKTNTTFRTWTGYTVEELLERSFVDLLPVGGRIYHETHYAPMLRLQGSVREIAVDVVRKDGSRLPVLVNARLDRDEEGRPLVVRIALFDATERRRYERELLHAKQRAEDSEERARSLARTLQQTLIPPTPPEIPGLDVAAAYRPAGDGSTVGGDLYDVYPLGTDDWGLVLGDVCGKGVDAAVVTALARYTVRALAVELERPSDVLASLDQVVQGHETDRFCTVVLARLRQRDDGWYVTLGTGGHPPPVLVRRDGRPELVPLEGSIVGVLAEPEFCDLELQLDPGDVLLLYTDGVTEARHGREFFGDERLLEGAGHGGSAADMVAALVEQVMVFQAGETRDDIAVLAIRVPG